MARGLTYVGEGQCEHRERCSEGHHFRHTTDALLGRGCGAVVGNATAGVRICTPPLRQAAQRPLKAAV